jgi:hypothetical protein
MRWTYLMTCFLFLVFLVLFSVAFLVLSYFNTVSHKWRSLRKKLIERNMCVLFFFTTFFWIISHSKNNWGRCYYTYTEVVMWSARCTWQSLVKIESFDKSNFVKICPAGTELLHAEGTSTWSSQWRGYWTPLWNFVVILIQMMSDKISLLSFVAVNISFSFWCSET